MVSVARTWSGMEVVTIPSESGGSELAARPFGGAGGRVHAFVPGSAFAIGVDSEIVQLGINLRNSFPT